ncbi:hypothetical protein [Halomonas maura]|uniref:hypothetical protein n=1 Tax=Halomonas maura TaxID=117606 RepID=UPI0025B5A893|nr:hypothetical protein [Halomonas maura]MDN3554786.1 hypothetical protein [Halomonas maura]
MRQDSTFAAASFVTETAENRNHSPPSSFPYHYATYGLMMSSQFELPELPSVSCPASMDVSIVAASLSETLEIPHVKEHWLQYAENCCQFSLEGVARYRIEQGCRIQVDRYGQEEQAGQGQATEFRPYLLGTALGALLHQRRWLPLHLSALNTPSGVWGFTGRSGAGKSTLAAWLHYHKGWSLISDDVGVVKPGETLPYLYPGPPRLKLCSDALTHLGLDGPDLVRDMTRADKYQIIKHRGFRRTARPLRHLVVLERTTEDSHVGLSPLQGLEAFQAVMAAIYRPECARIFTGPGRLLDFAADLARSIKVYRYRRPWSLQNMEQGLAPLIERIQHEATHDA